MKIEVNNTAIDFDGSLSMTENNPMFSEEMSYSLQATAKDTPTNRAAFGFINRPDISDNTTRELPAKISHKAMVLTGTIVVNWQGNAFNFYFKQNGDFWSKIKDKMLSDIAFEKTVFTIAKDYAAMFDYMSIVNADITKSFAFPVVLPGEKVGEKMAIKLTYLEINSIASVPAGSAIPIIPFLYLRFIYYEIFRRNGLSIANDDVFTKNDDLNRLVLPNNFLLNDFSIDQTPVSQIANNIINITNTTDPVVTTLVNHNLINFQIIKIFGIENNARIENRNFQIEVIDAKTIKLIGEDFSKDTKYNPQLIKPTTISHSTVINATYVNGNILDIQSDLDIISSGAIYYFHSDQYSGFVFGERKINIIDSMWVYFYNFDSGTITFTNVTLIFNKEALISFDNPFSLFNVQDQGIIKVLAGVNSIFNAIDPKSHVPSIKINDFLKECQKLFGIIPFVRNSVEIKSYNNILTQSDFIDITPYAEIVTEINNPGLTGYKLSFKADGNDNFYKTKLPVQAIDSKYTVKASVQAQTILPVTGSETNDVRLVVGENAYYLFNKSFLNADNNWKFLCFNLLDVSVDKGDFAVDTQFSTLISERYDIGSSEGALYLPKMDVAFANKNFGNDIKMAPRLLYYHGLVTLAAFPVAYASGELIPYTGNLNPASNFVIRWEGLNGLYEKFLKKRVYWEINTRKDCKAVIHFPGSLASNFDFSKKYRIGNINYLVKSRKYSLNFLTNQIKWNETELAKV